jgi:phosphatidylinositol-3-phosphatase
VSTKPAPSCDACSSPLAPDQRYCLACGERIGPRTPKLERLLAHIRGRHTERSALATALPTPALTLGSSPIALTLILAVLGFGILIGAATGPRSANSLAAVRPAVKLLLPASSLPPTESAAPTTGPNADVPSLPQSTPTPTPESSPVTAAPQKNTPAQPASPTSSSTPNGNGNSKSFAPSSTPGLPPIKHVFLVVLAEEPYATVFGPASPAPYLSHTLEKRGELLVRYYAVAHEELANEIAMLSGQGPTAETATNCPTYTDIAPAATAADQQVTGHGCVYPSSTATLISQLEAKKLKWRAYIEGLHNASSAPITCQHPALGSPDPTSGAGSTAPSTAGVDLATFRDPFVYFHAVIDSPVCATQQVDLDQLGPDLADPAKTPALSYIAPDLCDDGRPMPCAPGQPTAMPAADTLLKKTVPKILASKAYKDGGLLVITVDQAPSTGEYADSSSCCGQPSFPNLPAPTGGLSAAGGGEVGALLLSPYIKSGTVNQDAYNHFSLLRSIEDLFHLDRLGYAAAKSVPSFNAQVYNAYTGQQH